MYLQIEQYREQVAAICRHYRVRRLALFGSALGSDFDPARSDLDFVVEFEPLPEGRYADTYFGMIEFQRHVDLVEAGSVRNPYFLREIVSKQEALYGA